MGKEGDRPLLLCDVIPKGAQSSQMMVAVVKLKAPLAQQRTGNKLNEGMKLLATNLELTSLVSGRLSY